MFVCISIPSEFTLFTFALLSLCTFSVSILFPFVVVKVLYGFSIAGLFCFHHVWNSAPSPIEQEEEEQVEWRGGAPTFKASQVPATRCLPSCKIRAEISSGNPDESPSHLGSTYLVPKEA